MFVSMLVSDKNNAINAFLNIYSKDEMERMERSFLTLIEFNVNIKQSEYAHAYFLLRTYASSKDKSAPVKLISVNKVMELQKNSNFESAKKDFLKSM